MRMNDADVPLSRNFDIKSSLLMLAYFYQVSVLLEEHFFLSVYHKKTGPALVGWLFGTVAYRPMFTAYANSATVCFK